MHRHLRRLERIWLNPAISFVTTCTRNRKAILVSEQVATILIQEWRRACDRYGWHVGRYVIMPDHVHLFCAPEQNAGSLSVFVGSWKRWSSRRISELSRTTSAATAPIWQREFFDHLLRSEESYDQKWNYVRENPVRARLTQSADEWPWAGEIDQLLL